MQQDNTTVIGLIMSWAGSYVAAAMSTSIVSMVPIVLSSVASAIVIYKNYIDIKRSKEDKKSKK